MPKAKKPNKKKIVSKSHSPTKGSDTSGQKKIKPKTNDHRLMAKLTWLPKKTFELEFSIPWNTVKKTYDETLKKAAESAEIKGFRKGKAPISIIEKNIDKQKLYNEVLKNLLPQTYLKSLHQHNLKPICDPKVVPLETNEGKDWLFKATACESPDIKLGNYEAKIKGMRAKDKIWVPGKEEKDPPAGGEKKSEEQILKEIFDILKQETQIDIPPILLEIEEKRMLSRLLEQINKLGLTLDEYLANNNKSIEILKAENRKIAEDTLKMEFILQEIARKKKLETTEKEIQDMIKAVPDERTRKNLSTPMQKAYIGSIIRKRKVIDFLKNL